ncbi:MAG: hypothetical protein GW785_12440 [Flavobacteriia bacterium]|nr:hypothetical protein [Flavobacteriia bacterium]
MNQMEKLSGGINWWGLSGFTCAIAIASAVTLTVGTFGAGALIGATVGTVGCAMTTAKASWQ